jgi:hypothetical protein
LCLALKESIEMMNNKIVDPNLSIAGRSSMKDDTVESEGSTPFKLLCVEFVKWFALSVPFESNDTKEMLSALQEMAFSKTKNMNLELASKCL